VQGRGKGIGVGEGMLLVALGCGRLPGILDIAARYPFVVFGTMEGEVFAGLAACVVGGVLLGGGKGSVLNVIFGAFTLQAIVNLLNLLGLPKPYTDVVQGLIIIGAVAYVGLTSQKRR